MSLPKDHFIDFLASEVARAADYARYVSTLPGLPSASHVVSEFSYYCGSAEGILAALLTLRGASPDERSHAFNWLSAHLRGAA